MAISVASVIGPVALGGTVVSAVLLGVYAWRPPRASGLAPEKGVRQFVGYEPFDTFPGPHPQHGFYPAYTPPSRLYAHIFYEANTACLTASATYADAKACTETKATSLYGATVAASVTQAWEAVGVGGTTPPPATCTTTIALTNGVAVTGISGSTGGQVCYSIAVPTGSSNLVIATSGGQRVHQRHDEGHLLVSR